MPSDTVKTQTSLLKRYLKKMLAGSSDQMALFDQRWALDQTPKFSETIALVCSNAGLSIFVASAQELSSATLLEALSDGASQSSPELSNYRQLCEIIEKRNAGVLVIKHAHYLNGKSAHTLARLARFNRRNNLNWKFILLGKTAKIGTDVFAQLPLDKAYTAEIANLDAVHGDEQTSQTEPGFSFGDMAKYIAIALVLVVLLGGLMVGLSDDDSADVIVQVEQPASPEEYKPNDYSGYSLDEIYDSKARDLEFQEELESINRKSDVSVTEPEVSVTEPEVSVVEPEVSVVESEVNVTEPEVSVTEPEVSVAEPEVSVVEPEVSVAEPEVSVAEPQVSVAEDSQSQPAAAATPRPVSRPAIKPETTMPSSLENAITSDALSEVQAILSDGKLFDSKNQNGESLLILAINKKSDSIVDWLVTQAVDVNHVDRHGRSALFYSTIANKTDLVTQLLELGANPNRSSRLRKTPLMISVHNDYTEATELLIKAGANVNEVDHSGWSALFYAVWNNNKEITQLLLSIGANPNQEDSNGNTPIDVARSRPGNQLIGLLSSSEQ